MKSSWAYNNGKRMMREARENLDNSIPDHGWSGRIIGYVTREEGEAKSIRF